MPHLRPQNVAAALLRVAGPRPRGRLVLAVALCVVTSFGATNVDTSETAPTKTQNPRFGFAVGGNIQNLGSGELARYLDGRSEERRVGKECGRVVSADPLSNEEVE